MKRLCFVTTTPLFINFFLAPQLLNLRSRYEVSLALPAAGEVPLRPLPGIEVLPIPIRRDISPARDIATLLSLRRLFARGRFDLVHSFGPKAGLLAMHAGALAGVPLRLHTFTGQVWATSRGLKRRVLKAADRLTASAATHVLADSLAQREFMDYEGVWPAGRCTVLGTGSLSGVDIERFRPDPQTREAVRSELTIPAGDVVILYLGRLNRDKGVLDLARAFARMAGNAPGTTLAFVGPDEDGMRQQIESIVGSHGGRVRFVPYTEAPERYLAAADIHCLPSYREGVGTATLEAAASALPVVATRIYGLRDAVVAGETALVVEPGDVAAMVEALERLAHDPALRQRLGAQGRERIARTFSRKAAIAELEAFYRRLLGE